MTVEQRPPPAAEWIELSGESGFVRLRAVRCRDCGVYSFPPRDACPACTGEHLEPAHLGPYARLHSFTELEEPGDGNRSVLVGQLQFDEGPIVRAYIEAARDELQLDGPVELVAHQLPPTADLPAATTFAIRPARPRGGSDA